MTIQSEHSVRRWSSRRTIGRVFALSLAMTTVTATMGTAAGATPPSHGGSQDLGTNVTVFDPSTPVSEIQATLDATYATAGRQRDGHRPVRAPVQARRLRHAPTSRCSSRSATTPRSRASAPRPTTSSINGKIEVYNRCLGEGGTSNCLALANFWRTLCNLTIHINAPEPDGCRARRTSGRCRRRSRCAASTSPAATSR